MHSFLTRLKPVSTELREMAKRYEARATTHSMHSSRKRVAEDSDERASDHKRRQE